MRASGITLLPLVLLTLLAGATFWLERASQIDDGSSNGKKRHDPDFVVDNFTTRRFNLEGGLQHSLTAKKMLHYADDDTTDVTAPSLTYYGHIPPTRLTSLQASVSKDGKEVRLTNDVRMVREASADRPELVVTTSELKVFPDDEQARADVPVTIVDGQSTVHGTAMEADNRAQIFTLKGRVQGTIYRTTHKTP
ncbi:MAG: LPS export ABC transporter periplasmic protein LptC [Nevskiales bacterium]